MRIFLKRIVAIVSLVAVNMAFLGGCDNKNEKNVENYITIIISETNEAIEKKDQKQISKICSSLTELSLQLEKEDDKTLSVIISDIAGHYSYLLEYCLSGEEGKLKSFYKGMKISGQSLIDEMDARGFDTVKVMEEIEAIYKLD